jgi:hypothetical protein
MATAKKAHLGFIGAGWWATANYLPLLARRDDIELTAVCRLGQAELQQVKHRFGFQFATESAEELFNYPGLDAVFVVSHTRPYGNARERAPLAYPPRASRGFPFFLSRVGPARHITPYGRFPVRKPR